MSDADDPSSSRSAPLLRAQLESSPFSHFLVVAYERRLTGTLALQTTSDETVQIAFDEGRPYKARTSKPLARLGDVLVDLGHITKPRLARSATEVAVLRRLQGELLVEDGSITHEQLDEALEEQLRRKVLYAAALPLDSSMAFYERVDLMARWGGEDWLAIDPRPLVLRAIFAAPPWRYVESALARIESKAIALSRRAEIDAWGLSSEQVTAARALSRPTPTREWIAAVDTRGRSAELLLYALLIAKQVAVLDPEAAALEKSSAENGLSLSIAPVRSSMIPPPQPPRSGGGRDRTTESTPPSARVSPRPPPAARPRIEDVDRLLETQRVADAEALCREILASEAKNADALATLVWLEGLKPENQSTQATQRMINSLSRIATGAPGAWRPLFWRGQLYKRAGDHHAAARDFQQIVTMSPQHEAANAELRLYKMRVQRGSLPPPPKSASAIPRRKSRSPI